MALKSVVASVARIPTATCVNGSSLHVNMGGLGQQHPIASVCLHPKFITGPWL